MSLTEPEYTICPCCGEHTNGDNVFLMSAAEVIVIEEKNLVIADSVLDEDILPEPRYVHATCMDEAAQHLLEASALLSLTKEPEHCCFCQAHFTEGEVIAKYTAGVVDQNAEFTESEQHEYVDHYVCERCHHEMFYWLFEPEIYDIPS